MRIYIYIHTSPMTQGDRMSLPRKLSGTRPEINKSSPANARQSHAFFPERNFRRQDSPRKKTCCRMGGAWAILISSSKHGRME